MSISSNYETAVSVKDIQSWPVAVKVTGQLYLFSA